MYETSPLGLLLVGLLFAASLLLDAYRDGSDDSEEWSLEAAHQAYVDGEIGEAELERRLDRVLDDRAATIRQRVTEVRYVGPTTAARIADEFDSLQAVRDADSEELEDVHGVGESIAEEIKERV